jgi:hypothetical protein
MKLRTKVKLNHKITKRTFKHKFMNTQKDNSIIVRCFLVPPYDMVVKPRLVTRKGIVAQHARGKTYDKLFLMQSFNGV